MARKLKIMENEKYPLDDLKNDEINQKQEKNKTNVFPSLHIFANKLIVI